MQNIIEATFLTIVFINNLYKDHPKLMNSTKLFLITYWLDLSPQVLC